MENQKTEIIKFIEEKKQEGAKISRILKDMGIKRSTYYSWLKNKSVNKNNKKTELTPYEKDLIKQVKEEYPHLRHRQIQGIIQNKGSYISSTSIYKYLKSEGLIEPYARRAPPLKEPKYNTWRKTSCGVATGQNF